MKAAVLRLGDLVRSPPRLQLTKPLPARTRSGNTLVAAKRLGRNYHGIDVLPNFCQIARRRLDQMELSMAG